MKIKAKMLLVLAAAAACVSLSVGGCTKHTYDPNMEGGSGAIPKGLPPGGESPTKPPTN